MPQVNMAMKQGIKKAPEKEYRTILVMIYQTFHLETNLFLDSIFSESQLKEITDIIQDIVYMKVSDFNSLTNRAIFKYMNINDIINKTK